MSDLEFRPISMTDASWITECWNNPDVARYWWPYPRTEHEVKEYLKKELDISSEKNIITIAEIGGEPVGNVGLGPETGRSQHIAELGIFVRRRFWGRGVGSVLVREAIERAERLGIREIVLDTTEGNDRAIRLYEKFGFEIEAYQTDRLYDDGVWRKYYFMGLQLVPCEPRINPTTITQPSRRNMDSEKRTI